jgi:hypothetical protein
MDMVNLLTIFCSYFQYFSICVEYGIPLNLTGNERYNERIHQIVDAQGQPINEDEELGEGDEFLPAEIERLQTRRDKVTRTQWFRFMAHHHGPNSEWTDYHWLWNYGQLAQLYVLSFNNRMEGQKVQYLKRLQGKKRLVQRKALLNWLEKLLENEGKLA